MRILQYIEKLRKQKRLLITLKAGPFLLFTGWLFFDHLILSLLLLVFLYPVVKQVESMEIQREKEELREQFRDFLTFLSASITSGKQMGNAIEEAAFSLQWIYGKRGSLGKDLVSIIKKVKESNASLDSLLLDYARQTKVPDLQSFFDIYLISRQTGGNIELVMKKTIQILRDRLELKHTIRVLTSQKRMEARILTMMPYLVIFFLRLTSPEYVEVLYTTVAGKIIMVFALTGILLAYVISMKITEIKL